MTYADKRGSCLMLLICVPLWITEIAPSHGRGALANIHALMAVLGYLLASVSTPKSVSHVFRLNGFQLTGLGFYYYQHGSGNQWRAPLAFVALFPIITLICLIKLPESPRWLLSHDRGEEAWKIIKELHHTSDDPDGVFAKGEFLQMEQQYALDSSLDSSWKIMITRPSYRKRVFIACFLLSSIYSSGTLVISSVFLLGDTYIRRTFTDPFRLWTYALRRTWL